MLVEDEEPSVSRKKKDPLFQSLLGEESSNSPTGKASKEIELYKAEQPVKDRPTDMVEDKRIPSKNLLHVTCMFTVPTLHACLM